MTVYNTLTSPERSATPETWSLDPDLTNSKHDATNHNKHVPSSVFKPKIMLILINAYLSKNKQKKLTLRAVAHPKLDKENTNVIVITYTEA